MLGWVEEIERRAEEATPGPWHRGRFESYTLVGEPVRFVYRPGDTAGTRTAIHGDNCDADAAFIAASRTDVPRLCRAVRELAEALDAVVNAVQADRYGESGLAVRAAFDAEQVLERWWRGGCDS